MTGAPSKIGTRTTTKNRVTGGKPKTGWWHLMAVPHVATVHLYEGGKIFDKIRQDLGIKHCLLCM